MSAATSEEPRQTRGTVVSMPARRPEASVPSRNPAPPGKDHAEPPEEPGYGHGV
jgi:hypothetical protein